MNRLRLPIPDATQRARLADRLQQAAISDLPDLDPVGRCPKSPTTPARAHTQYIRSPVHMHTARHRAHRYMNPTAWQRSPRACGRLAGSRPIRRQQHDLQGLRAFPASLECQQDPAKERHRIRPGMRSAAKHYHKQSTRRFRAPAHRRAHAYVRLFLRMASAAHKKNGLRFVHSQKSSRPHSSARRRARRRRPRWRTRARAPSSFSVIPLVRSRCVCGRTSPLAISDA